MNNLAAARAQVALECDERFREICGEPMGPELVAFNTEASHAGAAAARRDRIGSGHSTATAALCTASLAQPVAMDAPAGRARSESPGCCCGLGVALRCCTAAALASHPLSHMPGLPFSSPGCACSYRIRRSRMLVIEMLHASFQLHAKCPSP